MIGHRRAAPRPLARRARDGERGSVLIMVAVSLLVIVTATALTVDLGRISTLRRDLQNVADATALDLVRLVDGRTAGEITLASSWNATRSASLARNGFTPGGDKQVTVQLGSYDVASEVFTPVSSAAVIPSAVLVVAADRVSYQFAPGGTATSRRAVAANRASAGFQVGSFAARLDSANSPLLSALLGDALGLSLVSYDGLVGARVGLDALATELGLDVGSPDELLGADLTLGELIAAQAAVLRRNGDIIHADILDGVVADLPHPDLPISLGDILQIANGGAAAAAVASLEVLDILAGAAFVANGNNALAVPGLDLGLAGVLATTTSVQVIEAPRIAFGGPGTSVSTAQVRLSTRVDLSVLGLAGVHVDLTLTAASATATVEQLSCGRPQVLGFGVDTGLVTARLTLAGQVLPLGPLGSLLTLGGTVVTNEPPSTGSLDFVIPPDAIGTSKPYAEDSLDLTGVTITPTATLLGAPVPLLPGVATLLNPLLANVVSGLNTAVVQPVLSLLGVSLPGADVTPLALRCTGADLVA